MVDGKEVWRRGCIRGRLWGFGWLCCWEREVMERFRGLGEVLEGGDEDMAM